MTRRCKYFAPSELVPKSVYERYADKEEIYALFEDDALRVLDWIRDVIGAPVVVNNWKSGGVLQNRGYRTIDSPVGAKRSAHKPNVATGKACAFDLSSPAMSAAQIRAAIEANKTSLPCKIRLEDGRDAPTWVHFDTRTAPLQKDMIYVFRA